MKPQLFSLQSSFVVLYSLILITTLILSILPTCTLAQQGFLEALPYTSQVGPAELTFHSYFHGSFMCGVGGCTNDMTMTLYAIKSGSQHLPQAAMLIIYFFQEANKDQPFISAHNSIFKLMNNGITAKRPFSSVEKIHVPSYTTLHIYGEIVYTNSTALNLNALGTLDYGFEFQQVNKKLTEQGDEIITQWSTSMSTSSSATTTTTAILDDDIIINNNSDNDNNNNTHQSDVYNNTDIDKLLDDIHSDHPLLDSILQRGHQHFRSKFTPQQPILLLPNDEGDDGTHINTLSTTTTTTSHSTNGHTNHTTTTNNNTNNDNDNDVSTPISTLSQFNTLDTRWTTSLNLDRPLRFFNQSISGEHYGLYVDGIRLLHDMATPREHFFQIRLTHNKIAFSSIIVTLIGHAEVTQFSREPGTRVQCTKDFGDNPNISFVLIWHHSKQFTISNLVDIPVSSTLTISCPELRFKPLSNHSRGIYAGLEFLPRNPDFKRRYMTTVPITITAQYAPRIDFGSSRKITPLVFLQPQGYKINTTATSDTYLTSVYCRYEINFEPVGDVVPTQGDIRDAKEKFKLFVTNATPLSQSFVTVVEGKNSLLTSTYKVRTTTQGIDLDPFILYEPVQISTTPTHPLSQTYFISLYIPLASSRNETTARNIQCQIWYEALSLSFSSLEDTKSSSLNNDYSQPIKPNDNTNTQFESQDRHESIHNYTNSNSNDRNHAVIHTRAFTIHAKTLESTTISNNQPEQPHQYNELNNNHVPFSPLSGSDEDDDDFKQFVNNYFSMHNNHLVGDHDDNNNNSIKQSDYFSNVEYMLHNKQTYDPTYESLRHDNDNGANGISMSTTASPFTTRRTTFSSTSRPTILNVMSSSEGLLFKLPQQAIDRWQWVLYPDVLLHNQSEKVHQLNNIQDSLTITNDNDNDNNNKDITNTSSYITNIITSLSNSFNEFSSLHLESYFALGNAIKQFYFEENINVNDDEYVYPYGRYTVYMNPTTWSISLRELETQLDEDVDLSHSTNQNNNENNNNNNSSHLEITSVMSTQGNFAPPRPKSDTMQEIFYLDPLRPKDDEEAARAFKTHFKIPTIIREIQNMYIQFSLNSYTFSHMNETKSTCTIIRSSEHDKTSFEVGFIKLTINENPIAQGESAFVILKFPNFGKFVGYALDITCPGVMIFPQVNDSNHPTRESDYYVPDDANRLLIYGTSKDVHSVAHKWAQQIPFHHFRIRIFPLSTILLISTLIGLLLIIVLVILARCCCRRNNRRVRRRKKAQNGEDDEDFFIRLDDAGGSVKTPQTPATSAFTTMGDHNLW